MDGCDLKLVAPKKDERKLDLMDLPALKLVINGIINVLFGRPLTTGSVEKDKVLKEILYSVNQNGRSGLDEIKDTVSYSLLYGKGLLVFNPIGERLYSVSPFRYQPYYYKENNLVKYIVMYQIYDQDTTYIYREPFRVRNKYQRLVTEQTAQGFFVSERICTEIIEKFNPLNTDRKRAEIVLTMLNEILNDIQTGGYGYVLVYGKNAYIGDEELGDAEQFQRETYVRHTNDRKNEVTDMLDDIVLGARKGGQYYDGWVEKVEQLKRMITPKDYEYFIQKSQQITCEILGIPPILLGLNETSRNVSIEHLLNQANVFFTMPWRQKVENYITKILKPHLGVEKIYFEEEIDEEEQKEDEN